MGSGAHGGKMLVDFHQDCQSLDLADFERTHGEAFLLHHGALDKLKVPVAGDQTHDLESPPGQEGEVLKPAADFLVFPLRSAGWPDADMIWIGRSDANELVIPDATISEVHAFILRIDGGYGIQDTGSRNGTWINDARVEPQGRGEPVALSSGARLRLGSVKLTFLLAQPFRSLVLGLLG